MELLLLELGRLVETLLRLPRVAQLQVAEGYPQQTEHERGPHIAEVVEKPRQLKQVLKNVQGLQIQRRIHVLLAASTIFFGQRQQSVSEDQQSNLLYDAEPELTLVGHQFYLSHAQTGLRQRVRIQLKLHYLLRQPQVFNRLSLVRTIQQHHA